ncbi:MAG: ATP-dependent DNA helicase [Lachnospiraceae bacterium]|nr:ATP-dependent DNA helicase [Lachnospiraceae bacterium]
MEFFKDSVLRISVRNLVEFILRSGDIDNRTFGHMDTDAMLEGSKIHRKIQKSMGLGYNAEVSLKTEVYYNDFKVIIEGRADGIFNSDTGMTVIDEIKGTYKDISYMNEPVYVHKAQAMCYGYMYGVDKEIDNIRIRMTYVNLDTEEVRYFEEEMTFEYVKDWFMNVVSEYMKWAEFMYSNNTLTQKTASELQFPFEYRDGQRDIVAAVYNSISRKKNLYIQAPTGVGKTMSVIFPSVKAMGEKKADKIFYITAKTITGTVAMQAYRILRDNGLHFRNIMITAKEKICAMEEVKCNPEYCPRAKGHYDRINDAVFDLINNEYDITREVIMQYAEKHQVCPFEMSLDVSNWVNGIICDYNYVFDPHVCLKRYFSEGGQGEYVVLTDEAHNLVDRAREMYSCVLVKEDIMEVKKLVKDVDSRLASALDKCNKAMLSLKRQSEGCTIVDSLDELAMTLGRTDSRFMSFFEKHNKFSEREKVKDLYFNIKNFLEVYDCMDEKYRIYMMIDDKGDFFVKLLCVNPSSRIRECTDRVVNTTFFSATLLPVNYYKELFTGDIEDYAIYVNSPFEQEKRLLLAAKDVSSKYTRRGPEEYMKIYNYIDTIVSMQKGNYMVFFPSYKLMEAVYDVAYTNGFEKRTKCIVQHSNMNESEREEFLQTFDETYDEPLVGFCVMGGIFSEGIDLTNDKLIGTIIIGTGLPQIGNEKDIIKNYFDDVGKNGFDYAYRYPGMNKVMQAAGRVIRTKDDVGVIALLDDRFSQSGYRMLFPREWDDCRYITLDELGHQVKDFWRRL